nr:Zn-dependent hydrolase [Mesorhizobium sp.]
MSTLRADFDAIAAIGRDPEGGWTRPAYGAGESEAHRWFAAAAEAAGLSVRQDAFGNSIARREGRPGTPAIAIGSHLDTVTRGGPFDGALGVLAGLEIARRVVPGPDDLALEIIAFRDEEGRFGALTGSRAMTGDLPADALSTMRDTDGTGLRSAMRDAGFPVDSPLAARRNLSELAAYLELHIEQGPVLETGGESIGIVTAIAGQKRLAVRFAGTAGHAGTTPMELRHDAFAAAAEFAVGFRDMIVKEGQGSARGTIGIVKTNPNQGNVIPSDVRIGLEIRDASAELLTLLAGRTVTIAAKTAKRHGVEVSHRLVYEAAPVPMAPRLVDLLEAQARAAGHASRRLLSGANHDAGILGAHIPAAMLFVPSRGGVSHTPEEHTDWHHIEAAVAVLEGCVRRLISAEHTI